MEPSNKKLGPKESSIGENEMSINCDLNSLIGAVTALDDAHKAELAQLRLLCREQQCALLCAERVLPVDQYPIIGPAIKAAIEKYRAIIGE